MSIGTDIDKAIERHNKACDIIENIEETVGIEAKNILDTFYDILGRKLGLPQNSLIETSKYTIIYDSVELKIIPNKFFIKESKKTLFENIMLYIKRPIIEKDKLIGVSVQFDTKLYHKNLHSPYSFSGDPVLLKEIKETYPDILLEIIQAQSKIKEKMADILVAEKEMELV